MVKEYIQVPLNTSLKGWTARWFNTRNDEPSLPANIDHLVEPNVNWSVRPSSSKMTQVESSCTYCGRFETTWMELV